MSDEYLRQEHARLSSHTWPNQKLRGYRGRVTSPDYYVEQQMQQLDKQRAADDQAQANAMLEELARRERARGAAELESWVDRSYGPTEAEGPTAFDRYQDQMRQNAEAYARMEAERERSWQESQALTDRYRAEAQRSIERLQRTTEESRRRTEEAWRLEPVQPAEPLPSIPPAYFPDLRDVTPPQQPSASPYDWD